MAQSNFDLSIWQEILPDFDVIDKFLKELLPKGKAINSLDWIEDMLKGNWVLEPMFLWEYVSEVVVGFLDNWKNLFTSIIVIFILSAVVTGFMSAFKNEGAAKAARMFFILCQMVVLINVFKEVSIIVEDTMLKMLEFLKIMLPAYMICVAATGSGLTAMIFYKLLLGFLCLIEGLVIASLTPVIEGYVILGVVEGVWGEDRFTAVLSIIKKGIKWILKTMIVILSGSGILQLIITPVIDKANISLLQKTAGAIPGIGDIAESVSTVTLASAMAVKNSMGVLILVILLLIIAAPVIRIFVILGTVKIACALGGICGEKQIINSVDHISEAGFLMLRMLITVTTLFFITIAAITNSTGGGI